jgi:hypothetical protein
MSSAIDTAPAVPQLPPSSAAAEFDTGLDLLAEALNRLAAVDLTAMTEVEVEDRLRRYVTETRRAPVVRNALLPTCVA